MKFSFRACAASPDMDKPFILWTDASERGFRAVLEQKTDDGECHPIAYASRCTNQAEKKYGISKLEVAALVFALEHFPVKLVVKSSWSSWLVSSQVALSTNTLLCSSCCHHQISTQRYREYLHWPQSKWWTVGYHSIIKEGVVLERVYCQALNSFLKGQLLKRGKL